MADLYPLSPSLFLDGYPQVDHALGLSSLPTSAPPQADQGKPGITTGENGKCLQNTFHVLWTQLGPDWLLIQTEMLRSSETWEEVNGQCRTFQNPHSTPAEEGALHSPEDHKLPRACQQHSPSRQLSQAAHLCHWPPPFFPAALSCLQGYQSKPARP